jgi:hypothetical protein
VLGVLAHGRSAAGRSSLQAREQFKGRPVVSFVLTQKGEAMKRNIKKQRDEAEKWRKAEEQHQAEKRKVYWDGFRQTYTDVQRELHAMLERHGDPKLYEDVGRVLAAVRDKSLERYLNEGQPDERVKEQAEDAKKQAKRGSTSLIRTAVRKGRLRRFRKAKAGQ